jgi:hypothetical protein
VSVEEELSEEVRSSGVAGVGKASSGISMASLIGANNLLYGVVVSWRYRERPSRSLLRNVPEGRRDRSHSTRFRLLMASLARSAWNSVPRKSRPVGYGAIRVPPVVVVLRARHLAEAA